MANIGTFTAEKDGFTGTFRTLTLNVKVTPNCTRRYMVYTWTQSHSFRICWRRSYWEIVNIRREDRSRCVRDDNFTRRKAVTHARTSRYNAKTDQRKIKCHGRFLFGVGGY